MIIVSYYFPLTATILRFHVFMTYDDGWIPVLNLRQRRHPVEVIAIINNYSLILILHTNRIVTLSRGIAAFFLNFQSSVLLLSVIHWEVGSQFVDALILGVAFVIPETVVRLRFWGSCG